MIFSNFEPQNWGCSLSRGTAYNWVFTVHLHVNVTTKKEEDQTPLVLHFVVARSTGFDFY